MRLLLKVSMHLLVLSAFRPFSIFQHRALLPVSMHLLVLSAFRPYEQAENGRRIASFNAPSGAQCFPTFLV